MIRVLEHKIYLASLMLETWAQSRFVIDPEYIEAKHSEMNECAWAILAALSE